MREWTAKWISHAYDPRQDLGVFAFRNFLQLDEVPQKLEIAISADNRYKLYVNGEMVAFGPQRGDERHWFYDLVDLAPHLKTGENRIVALVWNFGYFAPMAQHTVRTGFVVDTIAAFSRGLGGGEEAGSSAASFPELCTPGAWEVARLGWDFEMMHSGIGEFYIDVGPGEIMMPDVLDAAIGAREDVGWTKPHVICNAEERGASGGGTPWMLIPRTLPAMRYELREQMPVFRRGFVGDDHPDRGARDGQRAVERILVGPTTPVLLDYGELLCAYPRILAAQPVLGQRATVTLTYAESLWQLDGNKGNRNEVSGKKMAGYQDKLIVGQEISAYEPLWWRTYRYVLIETDMPVSIRTIDAVETGYPYVVESSFDADDPSVAKLWEVSVRTAERCAGETYFDCPYYEQLQYVGDTRIQSLIGYYAGRDRRLQRNAVETLGWSLMENGLTQSRYPSRQTQVIPPFSLWWVMMVYDQMLYDDALFQLRDDPSERTHDSTRAVVSAFKQVQRRERRGDCSFWNFGDWVPGWRWGVPPGGANSTTHWLTLMLADMARTCISFHASGDEFTNEPKERRRDFLQREVPQLDNLAKAAKDPHWVPSEHAEALFRVRQAMNGDSPDPWPAEALAAANAAKCTYYFSYYKHLAMFGREDKPFDYLAELQPWKEMIEDGLTTFAENPEPTRSDCHAWSAHLMLGFFQIVAGVTSISPGWQKAKIMPHPGSLRRFDARIAHPDGELRVRYIEKRLHINSPIPFDLAWQGKKDTFEPGTHTI